MELGNTAPAIAHLSWLPTVSFPTDGVECLSTVVVERCDDDVYGVDVNTVTMGR